MKRFNFFKYTTLGNKVDTTYFDYWFFKKLIASGEPTPPIEGEGTDFELETTTRKKFDVIELKGDTSQITYTGKNKVDFTTINFSGANNGTGTRDSGVFTVSAVGQSFSGIQFIQSDLQLKPDTTYTFSAKVVSTTAENGSSVYIISGMSAGGSNIAGNLANAGGISSATFTTPSSISNTASIRLYGRSAGVTAVFTDLQIEESSTATSYEPYVGGTASPNPDYPQAVNVVTGTQTLTITNGTDIQTYPITLGSIELAKIGTYQDYIYKSGDDWYVHKEVGKLLLTGSENWVLMSVTSKRTAYYTIIPDITPYTNSNATPEMLSDYFTPVSENGTWTKGLMSREKNNPTRAIFCMNPSSFTTTTDFTTWLSNNNTSLYYSLATPTDTQITDTTLISNLDTLLADGYLKKGTNAIKTTATSTNLPTIIYIKTN